MGKNNNQIATFADLHSIGYRVPSGKEDSIECITYADLRTMSDMYNVVLYHSYYNNENIFDIHFTSDFEGTTLSKNTWITSSLGSFTTPNCDLNTKISYFPTLYPNFTITAPQSNRLYGNMTLILQIEDQSGNVQILDSKTQRIEINAGITDQNGGWTKKSYNAFTWTSSTSFDYDYAQLQIKPNTTYYIKLRVYFSPETMSTQYGDHKISFVNGYSSAQVKYYSANKCVPWQYVKGSLGQTTSSGNIVSNAASITVPVYLKESISNDPDFDQFIIKYHYKQGDSWKELAVASNTSIPEYTDSYTFNIKIPIHPIEENEVDADYMGIWCGTLASSRLNYPDFKWTITRLDGTTITNTYYDKLKSEWTSASQSTAVKGGYTSFLRNLKSITLSIQ